MYFFLIFCFVFVKADNKIYGGKNAEKKEFPFLVFLAHLEGTQQKQGVGFLLALDKVMTAAHFIHPGFSDKNAFMIAGVIDKTDTSDPGYQKRGVKNHKVHPKYQNRESMGKPNLYDIASLEPDKPFEESETLKTGKIPAIDAEGFKKSWKELVTSGKTCYAVGWGSTSMQSPQSDILKKAETKPISDEECQTKTDLVSQGGVCSQNTDTGDGPCGGDSGSPYVCNGVVYGVYLAGRKCGSVDNVSIYLLLGPFIKDFDLEDIKDVVSVSSSLILKPILITFTILFCTQYQ